MTQEMSKDNPNPLQMKDQNDTDDDAPVEPVMTEWTQPFSPGPEPPTSTPANPPQPRNPEQYPEAQADAATSGDDDSTDDES